MKIFVIIRAGYNHDIRIEDGKGYSSYDEALEIKDKKISEEINKDPEHRFLDEDGTIWFYDSPFLDFYIEPVEFMGCQIKISD